MDSANTLRLNLEVKIGFGFFFVWGMSSFKVKRRFGINCERINEIPIWWNLLCNSEFQSFHFSIKNQLILTIFLVNIKSLSFSFCKKYRGNFVWKLSDAILFFLNKKIIAFGNQEVFYSIKPFLYEIRWCRILVGDSSAFSP